MNLRELLSNLERRDIQLSANEDRLRVDAPLGVITDDLKRLLREHKPDLLRVLQHPGTDAAPSAESIEAMSLEVFAQAGLIVRVHSDVLGKDVLFVSDNVPEEALAGREPVVYRAHELRKLESIREPRHLRTIDATKAIFNGTVTEVR